MKTALLSLALLATTAAFAQDALINEVDYDQPSTDTEEFIEVAIDLSSCGGACDPTQFDVVTYNGTGGVVLRTNTLPAAAAGSDGIYALYVIDYPTNGLQNDTEGIALVYNGGGPAVVLEFISYEGTVTATEGPANGLTSTDIGVADSNGSPNLSLQRLTPGSSTFVAASPTSGTQNSTVIPVRLASFAAVAAGRTASLAWTTASELDNAFFAVEASRDGAVFTEVGRLDGGGTTAEATDYDFAYRATERGRHYFRLAQHDFDGQVAYSPIVTADLLSGRGFGGVGVVAHQLHFELDASADVRIVDLRGATVAEASFGAGPQRLDVSDLSAGIYLLTDGRQSARFVRQ